MAVPMVIFRRRRLARDLASARPLSVVFMPRYCGVESFGLVTRRPEMNEIVAAGSIVDDAAESTAHHRGGWMRHELVERAMRGDRDAFTALARDSADRCYALAYRILRDPHRAQDATQQALLGAWRDLPALRDPERFDAWLRRLVVNACYAEARGHRRRTANVRLITLDTLDIPGSPDVARSVAARDELDGAFRRLTPEQRAVVVLHHHLGYPLTEIAATLGIPEGTARSRLHHAVRQLRTVLDHEGRSRGASKERTA
jgi:RNA polymerase sigma-70 factor (ECF subfamily)